MFTPDGIFYTDIVRCVCDKYQVWLMAWRILTNLTINEAYIMREKITNGRYHDNDLILNEYIHYHDIFIDVESTIWWQFCWLVVCDIWDTDYNTDNWEPGFMTIFVTWQLIVTLDSICNSCDIFVTNIGGKFVDMQFFWWNFTHQKWW